jgi:hypothetical protein
MPALSGIDKSPLDAVARLQHALSVAKLAAVAVTSAEWAEKHSVVFEAVDPTAVASHVAEVWHAAPMPAVTTVHRRTCTGVNMCTAPGGCPGEWLLPCGSMRHSGRQLVVYGIQQQRHDDAPWPATLTARSCWPIAAYRLWPRRHGQLNG